MLSRWFIRPLVFAALTAAAVALWRAADVHALRPALLLLLAAAPWAWWTSRRSIGGLGPGVSRLVLLLRIAGIVLFVLALADLQGRRESDHLAVLYLLDESNSIPRDEESRRRHFDYMQQQAQHRRARDEVGLAVFGKNVSVETGLAARPFRQERLDSHVNRDYTDIGEAIRMGTALFPTDARKRIVLFTDGNDNAGRVLDEARNAAAQGVAIDVYPIRYDIGREIWVEKVLTPSDIRADEPFIVTVVVGSTRAAPALLELYEDGRSITAADAAEGQSGLRVDLKPTPHKNVFQFRRRLSSPALHRYEARIIPLGNDDVRAENNTAHGFTFVSGKSRILIIAKTPEDAKHLQGAIRDASMAVEVQGASQVPADLDTISSYDCIVLANVDSSIFAGKQHMRAYADAVRDAGVGLVMIGGQDSFSSGGYRDTPIEEALPVTMDVKMRKILPSGAIVLVIDRSGSMGGGKLALAKQAAIATAHTLGPHHELGVVVFDASAHWAVPLGARRDKQAIEDLIRKVGSGGGTNVYKGMVAALQALKGSRAMTRHMIVLTDGHTQGGNCAALAEAALKENITITTVGVGPSADVVLLQDVANRGGGVFHMARDARQVPQIFVREAAQFRRRGLIANEPFTPVLQEMTPPVQGFGKDAFPTLLAFVVTEAKARAQVPLLATYEGEPSPLLAHWQYGLGRSVAFTSDATGNWAKHWVSDPVFSRFWTQLMRWVARKEPPSDLELTVKVRNGEGHVVVEAFDEEGRPLDGLDLEGFARWPEAESTDLLADDARGEGLVLQQVGPGRYEAQFKAERVGTYLVSVSQQKQGEPPVIETSGLSVSYSPEYRDTGSNEAMLQRLAAVSTYGGLLSTDPRQDNVFRTDMPASLTYLPLWRPLLWMAFALFLADIFLRRVLLDWQRIAARILAWGAPIFPVLRRPWERLQSVTRSTAQILTARRVEISNATPERKKQLLQELTQYGDPVDETKPDAPVSESAAEDTSEKPKDTSADPDSYTGRLLQAKKRATRRSR